MQWNDRVVFGNIQFIFIAMRDRGHIPLNLTCSKRHLTNARDHRFASGYPPPSAGDPCIVIQRSASVIPLQNVGKPCDILQRRGSPPLSKVAFHCRRQLVFLEILLSTLSNLPPTHERRFRIHSRIARFRNWVYKV